MAQVVDTASAQEFMRETLARITESELAAIADELEVKHARFRDRLSRRPIASDDLQAVLRSIFSTRRRIKDLFDKLGPGALAGVVAELLDAPTPVEQRLETFCDRLADFPESLRYDLGSELLHYTDPERYWLWTRWIWDPRTRTGALPLVTMEEFELDGGSMGATYRRIGEATAFVHETGRAAGFTRIGQGRFGVDVYLACVYCVYVYTTVRIRMTQEFNRVIPPLGELCRRFVGTHRMEV